MKIEQIMINKERNVTLTAYLQMVGGEFAGVIKRPAILILPGGAYQFCSEREADPVAMVYLQAGYQVFILRYSVAQYSIWPNPLNDYEEAMQLIRSKEDVWNLYGDKIAVIGFSAGGHLAAVAATMSQNRPNAAILGYPLIDDDVNVYLKTAPNVLPYIDPKTCACFIFASRTDNVVSVMNSVKMMEALTKAEVSFESHIYGYGPHGFSTAEKYVQDTRVAMCARIPNWVSDSISWLKEVLGDYDCVGMTEPICKSPITGDKEEFLSVDCTIGCLLQNKQAATIIEEMVKQMQSSIDDIASNQQMMENSNNMEMAKRMKLIDALGMANVNKSTIEYLDSKLRTIANK